MIDYAISNGLTPFISMQNFHNAAYREEEREMIPTLKVGYFPPYWNKLIPRCSALGVFLGRLSLEAS